MTDISSQIITTLNAYQHSNIDANSITNLYQTYPPNLDAFGRLRVSEPYTLFDSQNRYQINRKFFSNIVGTANVGYTSNESTVTLNLDTASGSRVIRQSKNSFAYQPGKSLMILNTFVMEPSKSNLVQKVGYFNALNGVFIEQSDDVYMVIRNNGSDFKVRKADWNTDSLPELDMTKIQIMFTDIEWLGAGTVRTGFLIDGEYKYAHLFHHANRISNVYMTTAILPLRYEIENTGITSSPSTLKQICSTVISEGGYNPSLPTYVNHRDVTTLTLASTMYPMISIRLKPGFLDSLVRIKQIDLLSTSKDSGTWYLLINPTITTPNWLSHPDSNLVQYDISSTTVSGGITIESGFFAESAKTSFTAQEDIIIGLNDLTSSDIITLACLSYTPSATVVSKIGWNEI